MAIPNKRLNKQMSDFVAHNIDLIAEYDSTEGTYPFDYCKYDILEKMAGLQKAYKGCDFRTILRNALQDAIKYQEPVLSSLHSIINSLVAEGGDFNTTQTYFREVGELYKRHKGDLNIKYCPENREKLIELNTKMVISVAKRYQGLGLSLQELISAGNLGLCTAWEKYDPSKSQLKDDILAAVQDIPDHFSSQLLMTTIEPYLSYGSIKTKFEERFVPGKTYKKTDLLAWIDKNIYNAKFSSICMMWIKAFILIEIDNASRLVKKPKSEIYKDKELTGSYQKESLLDLDQPIAGDTETTFADTLGMEDDSDTDLEIIESYDEYKAGLNKLLEGVGSRDRAVLLKKFGIGLPRPLTPQEISATEQLSVARISQICLNVLAKMRMNAAKYDIDETAMFEYVSHFR